jgi:hypothetical protein
MNNRKLALHPSSRMLLCAFSFSLLTASFLSIPLAAQTSGKLVVTTEDAAIVTGRLVFSTVDEEIRSPKSVTLTNSGAGTLTISSLVLGDCDEVVNAVNGRTSDYKRASDFQILNAPALPLSIAPGQAYELSIQFAPQRGSGIISGSPTHTTNGENYASLTITSSDPSQPSAKVQLAGLNAFAYEGTGEPSVAEIARSFGLGSSIGSEALKLGGVKAPLGEEIYSPNWLRASQSKPLLLWPLARYAARKTGLQGYTKYRENGSEPTIYAFPGGSDVSGGENQRLLPKVSIDGSTVTPTAQNIGETPATSFSLKFSGSYTNDTLNTPDQPHNWRTYPLRDSQGKLIPNNWYAIVDPGNVLPTEGDEVGKNFDYQDGVFLLSNARPESANLDPSVPKAVPGNSSLVLFFRSAVSGTLADSEGKGIGFTSTQRNKNDTFTSTPSFDPSSLFLNTGSATGTLVVTTTNSSPSRSDNTLINGLQLAFDGRSIPFTVSSKILGPLNQINTPPFQQAGIFLGPDQDNFIKVVVRSTDVNTLGIEFYQERRAVGTTLSTVSLANPGSLQNLELFLIGDPSAGTVKAAYRAVYTSSDTGRVNLPGTVNLVGADFGRYFDPQSKAGILAYSKDSPSFKIVFDNFQIVKTNP